MDHLLDDMLSRGLKNWAALQKPPAEAREQLLKSGRDVVNWELALAHGTTEPSPRYQHRSDAGTSLFRDWSMTLISSPCSMV